MASGESRGHERRSRRVGLQDPARARGDDRVRSGTGWTDGRRPGGSPGLDLARAGRSAVSGHGTFIPGSMGRGTASWIRPGLSPAPPPPSRLRPDPVVELAGTVGGGGEPLREATHPARMPALDFPRGVAESIGRGAGDRRFAAPRRSAMVAAARTPGPGRDGPETRAVPRGAEEDIPWRRRRGFMCPP